VIITGDDYEIKGRHAGSLFSSVSINIFNISKINSEVRGGKSRPRLNACQNIWAIAISTI
jgi:type III restriction enzyme